MDSVEGFESTQVLFVGTMSLFYWPGADYTASNKPTVVLQHLS